MVRLEMDDGTHLDITPSHGHTITLDLTKIHNIKKVLITGQ